MTQRQKQNLFWGLTVGLAFAAVISFFQINSYAADKHKLNGMWTVLGVILGVAACVSLYLAIKNSGGGSDGRNDTASNKEISGWN